LIFILLNGNNFGNYDDDKKESVILVNDNKIKNLKLKKKILIEEFIEFLNNTLLRRIWKVGCHNNNNDGDVEENLLLIVLL